MSNAVCDLKLNVLFIFKDFQVTSTPLKGTKSLYPLHLSESPILENRDENIMDMDLPVSERY